jgi:hypothetical protein
MARVAIVSRNLKAADDLFSKMSAAGEGAEAGELSKKLTKSVDTIFEELGEKSLLNEKLQAHRDQWVTLREKIMRDPRSRDIQGSYSRFVKYLVDGAKGTKCTVVVSASNGEGARVKEAKAADAVAGGSFIDLGNSTVVAELEPAEYFFKAFRKDKETGHTDRVKCTDTKKPVSVKIDEKSDP